CLRNRDGLGGAGEGGQFVQVGAGGEVALLAAADDEQLERRLRRDAVQGRVQFGQNLTGEDVDGPGHDVEHEGGNAVGEPADPEVVGLKEGHVRRSLG